MKITIPINYDDSCTDVHPNLKTFFHRVSALYEVSLFHGNHRKD